MDEIEQLKQLALEADANGDTETAMAAMDRIEQLQSQIQAPAEPQEESPMWNLFGSEVGKFAKGVVSEGSKLVSGAEQWYGRATDNPELVARATQDLTENNAAYKAFDEKQIGAEDLGEFTAVVAPFLATRGVVGSSILGGLVEGVKGTEEGTMLSQLANAGTTAGASLVMGGLGKAIFGRFASRYMEPETAALAAQQQPLGMIKKAGNLAANTILALTGNQGAIAALTRGASHQVELATVSQTAAFQAKRAARLGQLNADTAKAVASRATQLDDQAALYWERARKIYEGMTPEARGTAIADDVLKTVKQTVDTATKTLERQGTKTVTPFQTPKPRVRVDAAGKPVGKVPGAPVTKGQAIDDNIVGVQRTETIKEVGGGGRTYEDLLQDTFKPLKDGRLGIDAAKFQQNFGLLAEKDLASKVGEKAARQITTLKKLMERNGKRVISQEQLRAQIAEMTRMANDDIMRMITEPANAAEKRAGEAFLQSIIDRTTMAAAGGASVEMLREE